MSTIQHALKTSRQVAATAGLVLGAFGLPALMAGGVMIPTMVPPEAVEWMGTGDDDPVVYVGMDESSSTGSTQARAEGSDSEDARASEPGPERTESAVADAADTREAAISAPIDAMRVDKRAPSGGGVQKAIHRKVTSNRGVDVEGGDVEAHNARIAKLAAERKANMRGRRCQDPIEGITHLYGERYVVARDVIERYSTVEAALKLGRVAWHKDERGKTDGFRMTRVACGSPLAQVGIRPGDVVHSINGKNVRTLPQAFAAVRKVKRRDAIHVEMSRGGQRLTKMLTVE